MKQYLFLILTNNILISLLTEDEGPDKAVQAVRDNYHFDDEIDYKCFVV